MLRRYFCAIFICISTNCFADTVYLSNGQVLEGELIEFRKEKVNVATSSGGINVHYRLIDRIESDGLDETKKELIDAIMLAVDAYKLKAEDQEERHQARMSSHKVDFYMYPQCRYCQKMERYLKQNNIEYNRYNILVDAVAKQRYERVNQQGCGLPFIVIDDQYTVCGYNAGRVKKYLTQ